MADNDSYCVFSGTSHPQFAEEISSALFCPVGKIDIHTFPDGEIGVQLLDNVRGKEVFILQSLSLRPNHFFMELFIIVDAMRRASAKNIIAVLPYYGYARQDRKDKGRTPISAKLMANLLEKAGVTRVLTMDLHTPQIQGFFDIPVDDLLARPLLIEAIKKNDLQNLVIVSPDLGSNKMARAYAEDLGVEIAIVDKRRISSTRVDAKALIGEVKGKDVCIVDDICSTAETLKLAERVCSRAGARKIFAAVTHYLGDETMLDDSKIEKVFITNTIPCHLQDPRFEAVSVAGHFSQAIECVLNAKSISSLYR